MLYTCNTTHYMYIRITVTLHNTLRLQETCPHTQLIGRTPTEFFGQKLPCESTSQLTGATSVA